MKIVFAIIPICVAIFGIIMIMLIPSDPSSICSENELEWVEEKQFCIGMSQELCEKLGGKRDAILRGAEWYKGTREDVLHILRGCQF